MEKLKGMKRLFRWKGDHQQTTMNLEYDHDQRVTKDGEERARSKATAT